MNITADQWSDYELLDAGDGMKLERWGNIILSRPDPQAIWKPVKPELWKQAHAVYIRSSAGGGSWKKMKEYPSKWTVSYKDLRFYIEPTGFKHTGLFPEQAANWEWMRKLILHAADNKKTVRILNLFGYTGGAAVACAAAGAAVCHVDASKGMVTRARENVQLSGLSGREVRYIVEDAFKFVAREIRRGSRYDGFIMDPPSYGRGPNGEVWRLEDQLYDFAAECGKLLSDRPLFFLLNSYTTGFSSEVTGNILKLLIAEKYCGEVVHGDVCLPITAMRDGFLPCGSYAAWRIGEKRTKE